MDFVHTATATECYLAEREAPNRYLCASASLWLNTLTHEE